MKKKKNHRKKSVSLLEDISDTLMPNLESIHIKAPRRDSKNVSLVRNPSSVSEDSSLIQDYKLSSVGVFTLAHTHPREYKFFNPSSSNYKKPQTTMGLADIAHFLSHPKDVKFYGVVQKDERSGKISGELIVKKRNLPSKIQKRNRRELVSLMNALSDENRIFRNSILERDKEKYLKLKKEFYDSVDNNGLEETMYLLADDYGLLYRFIPLSENDPINVSNVTSLVFIIGFGALIFGSSLFFYGFTGNVVLDLSNKSLSLFGIISFVLGLIFLYFYFRNK